jgi:hypothetical protein
LLTRSPADQLGTRSPAGRPNQRVTLVSTANAGQAASSSQSEGATNRGLLLSQLARQNSAVSDDEDQGGVQGCCRAAAGMPEGCCRAVCAWLRGLAG